MSLEELAALVKKFDDPQIPAKIEVGDEETLGWVEMALRASEPANEVQRCLGLPVTVDGSLPARSIRVLNRAGHPIRCFVRTSKGKLLMLDISGRNSFQEQAAEHRWVDWKNIAEVE